MRVDEMNDTGVKRVFGLIMAGLVQADPEVLRELAEAIVDEDPQVQRTALEFLVPQLDYMDGDDTFGTEGWRHAFGVED